MEESSPLCLQVGSAVRAFVSEKMSRRAVVATIHEDDTCTAEVIWEPWVEPISRFVGTSVATTKDDEEEETAVVSFSTMRPLLAFEMPAAGATSSGSTPKVWKERGDQLLKEARDPSTAASYYQRALQHKSGSSSIGSSILVVENGRCVVAEVDCCEEDSSTLDVTMVATGEEKTIPETMALLVITEDPHRERFQERTLLNLARCCLQLGDAVNNKQKEYRKNAVLTCTMALTLHEYHTTTSEDTTASTEVTALLLRSQAQEHLGKFPHAKADLRRILQKLHPNHGQAQRALQRLEKKQKSLAKTNRKLARDVSQWVQTAVSTTTLDSDDSPTSPRKNNRVHNHHRDASSDARFQDGKGNLTSRGWIVPIAVVVVAILISLWIHAASV